jgi:tetratricopeptide (TPR) repeat protein
MRMMELNTQIRPHELRRSGLRRSWPAPFTSRAVWLLAGMIAFGTPYAAAMLNSSPEREQYSIRLRTARDAYFQVITSKDQGADARAHEALAEFERAYPGDPVGKAYHGSLELLDAAHSWAVWNLHKQAADGLSLLDEAVGQAPDEPEARFIRAATSWHLPGFYHRWVQCEADFEVLAGQAEEDVRQGRLIPELGAATLNYWGQILVGRNDLKDARTAFERAVRIAPQSPAGLDAGQRLAKIR